MNFDEMDGKITKIDTSKPLRRSTIDLYEAVVELQTKLNELIDVVNIMTTPDDEDDDIDDEEDNEQTVINPKQVNLGAGRKIIG